MSKYLLLLHEPPDGFSRYSPEEMQAIIRKYQAWHSRLAEAGRLHGSEKLRDDGGRRLSRKGGRLVVDGPFSETKEVIGGFFLIEADGYEEAAQLCRDCPHLDYGSIELREVEPIPVSA